MPSLPWPVQLSLFCWFALEIGLLMRDVVRRKGRRGQDRGTRAIVSVTLVMSILIGWLLRRWVPALDTPAADAFTVAGVIAIWAGLAVRIWAVLTLAGSFSTFLEINADQAVVTRGPYRWVRHPSYSGLLLIALGLGLAAGNWLSLVVCTVGPALGLVPRITVEESELVRVLGEEYRAYQRETRRLVPKLW